MIGLNQISVLELLLTGVFGWLLGMVVNYLADVLPITRRLSHPTCLYCAKSIPYKDYFLFKKCESCKSHRSARTWIVQVLMLILMLVIGVVTLRRIDYWTASFLLTYFAVIVTIDFEYRVILHPVSLVGAIGGFFLGWHLNGLESTLLGGGAGFLIMLSLYYLGKLFVRITSRRTPDLEDEVALGFGDVILGGVIGLMLGWMDVVGGLLLAILLGGIISGLYIAVQWIARRYKPLSAIPYGPFLVVGAMIYLFVPVFY